MISTLYFESNFPSDYNLLWTIGPHVKCLHLAPWCQSASWICVQRPAADGCAGCDLRQVPVHDVVDIEHYTLYLMWPNPWKKSELNILLISDVQIRTNHDSANQNGSLFFFRPRLFAQSQKWLVIQRRKKNAWFCSGEFVLSWFKWLCLSCQVDCTMRRM